MQLSTSDKKGLLQYLLDTTEANKDTDRILDAILGDREFLEEIQVATFSTIVANLQVKAKQNTLKILVERNELSSTIKKPNLYVDLIQGDSNGDI